MKRILLSLLVIGGVSAALIFGTRAYYSDTEESVGNTISSGTIDIQVDGENPWAKTYTKSLEDLKPSYVRFMEFTVKNVGTNSLRLWKHIKNIETNDGIQSEPECTEGGGGWDKQTKECTGDSYTPKHNIHKFIEYDMYIGGEVKWDTYDSEQRPMSGHVDGGFVVIDEKDGITLDDIRSHYIYIGELKPGEKKKIIQSYHLKSDTGNWAQGDTVTFDVELLALQENDPGPEKTTLMLYKKDTSWNPLHGAWGMLTYKTVNNTFDYDFVAQGLTPDTNYSLIYYADPYPGDHPGAYINSGTSDGSGKLSFSGNPDLSMNLPDPADGNYPAGAKFWLVLSNDYDGTKMTGWHQDQYLYEYNLVKYVDPDL